MIVLKYTTKGQVIPLLIRSICKHFCAKIIMGGLGGVEGGNFYRGKSFQTTQHVAQILFLPNVFL